MRRRLVFDVPKGKETHYSKIRGRILGPVWAPIYHAYSYYLPASKFPSYSCARLLSIDQELQVDSEHNLRDNIFPILFVGIFGWTPLWRSIVGGIVWAESESLFATWDGHVTFGSSHVYAHIAGFTVIMVVRTIFMKTSILSKLLVLAISYPAWGALFNLTKEWAEDGFRPVSLLKEGYTFRVDHVAHIGGLLTGAINAYFTKSNLIFK